MGERTNDQRAERARAALEAYKAVENEGGSPDASEDIVDLLVDLHHYLVKYGKDNGVNDADDAKDAMDNLLVSAAEHFECEVSDEG